PQRPLRPMRIGSADLSRARVARTSSGGLSVDRVDFGFQMHYDVEPLGLIGLCDVTSGTLEDHAPDGSRPQRFGPGELFVLSPPDRPYGGTVEHARYTVTMIDTALLDEVAAPSGRGSAVELLDHRPLDAAAAQRLRAVIDHLDATVLGDPVA